MNAFIDHVDVFEDEMTGGEVNSEKSEQTVESVIEDLLAEWKMNQEKKEMP